MLRQWVTQPSTETGTIRWRHECVGHLVEHPQLLDAIRSRRFLRGSADLDGIQAKLLARQADLRDLIALYEFVGVRLPGFLEVCEDGSSSADTSAKQEAGTKRKRAPGSDGANHRGDTSTTTGVSHLLSNLREIDTKCEGFRKLVETTMDVEQALGASASKPAALSSLSGWAGS